MKEAVLLLQIGSSARLERVLCAVHTVVPLRAAAPVTAQLCRKRLLFAVHLDAYGPDAAFCMLLRRLRAEADCLRGCVAGILVDGDSELYTKSAAQELALAASMAGCTFPGKPLVEGTASLYNQHILAKQLGLSWEETYCARAQELARLVQTFVPPHAAHPQLLLLHASENARSNTLWMGREVAKRLTDVCSVREISLRNGTIYDCRGCSYEACLHFAQNQGCYYGGAISEEVLPAIQRCNAMLFLCPNYNDSVSANILALFNRLTNLLVQQNLSDKYLFGIIVSGYSGSDLVARQLLGAMCFNKTTILPPHFCMMQTAHDPGSAAHAAGIEARLTQFSKHIRAALCGTVLSGDAD